MFHISREERSQEISEQNNITGKRHSRTAVPAILYVKHHDTPSMRHAVQKSQAMEVVIDADVVTQPPNSSWTAPLSFLKACIHSRPSAETTLTQIQRYATCMIKFCSVFGLCSLPFFFRISDGTLVDVTFCGPGEKTIAFPLPVSENGPDFYFVF